tara:strand:- start:2100 stop:2264 length:165 start_codon:yes stop_codon:yes gene_type:complete
MSEDLSKKVEKLEKELQELKLAATKVYHIVRNAKDPDDHIKNLRSLIFSKKKVN